MDNSFHTLSDWQRTFDPWTSLGAATVVCITWYIDVRTDFKRWDKGNINHIRGALLRLIGFIPATLLDWHSGLLWLVYWPCFDGVLGVWKARKDQWHDKSDITSGWWYLGTTSRLDRLQHKYPWLVTLKYLLAVGALVIYILIKMEVI